MAQLDIIITHYNEVWANGRTMFEMLRMQRGINPGDFRVILVQDGASNKLDLQRILRVYPFLEKTALIPHGGVSAARNEGLRLAESEWVMFCDFDDCFRSVDSLQRILGAIREAGDRADMLSFDFLMEIEVNGEIRTIRKDGSNRIFIHGKCWRREFLEEHSIRFDEELSYSEDALFNEYAVMESQPERRAFIKEALYIWCLRKESLSNYTGGETTRNLSLFRKRVKTIRAFEERGREYDADCSALRALIEYYFELYGQKALEGGTREEWMERIRTEILERHPNAVYSVSPYDRAKIYGAVKEGYKQRGMTPEGMKPLGEWLAEIGAIRKEDTRICVRE